MPKVECLGSLWEYKPIFLVGILYILVAKVMDSRLGRIMDALMAHNKSDFIRNRHLADRVVVVNEVVDYAKRFGKECMIFKVDFEKSV